MVNKKLFNTRANTTASCSANNVNEAGGNAYCLSDKAALAQYVLTGCLNGTCYASDKSQLAKTINLAKKVDSAFIAKLAVYARQQGFMKDMPALLLAILCKQNPGLFAKTFHKVVDNPKMLRTFVQILRSGVTGRKSLGSLPKKLIQNYLSSLTDEQLFKADIGNNPSLPDLIKMVHPKPSSNSRSALYAYLLNKPYNHNDLNSIVSDYEQFKKTGSGHVPNVPFQMLTALPLTPDHWKQIATHATWNQVRMNLNTFARHGVFDDHQVVKKIATKLSDKTQVLSSKVFPYQLYSTFISCKDSIPVEITNALQDAVEYSLDNVPTLNGKVYVMIDVSGSMSYPISGHKGSVSSKMRCVDIASVFASAILRKNPNTEVIPFDFHVHTHGHINPQDSIMTNAEKLSAFGGGGTNCSAALKYINENNDKGDVVIYISDNQSWMDHYDDHKTGLDDRHYNSTVTMRQWEIFKQRNPHAKLINIDIQPYATTQTVSRNDVLNIGGFSDSIFTVISKFVESGNSPNFWVDSIESIDL